MDQFFFFFFFWGGGWGSGLVLAVVSNFKLRFHHCTMSVSPRTGKCLKIHELINQFSVNLLQSEKAGEISQHQLLVATRLGNPVLAAQCKVFAALSLIQRGQLKLACRIIRFVTGDQVLAVVHPHSQF